MLHISNVLKHQEYSSLQREIVFVGFLIFTMQVEELNLFIYFFTVLSGKNSTVNLWSKYFQSIQEFLLWARHSIGY